MDTNVCFVNNTDVAYPHKNLEAHCLVCNITLVLSVADAYNIFKTQIVADSELPKLTVLDKIRQVLNKPSTGTTLHSEIVCHRCFNLLAELHSTEAKLNALRSELVTRFVETVALYEPGSKSEKTTAGDENKLVITEEGKVVDKNGVEKFSTAKTFGKKIRRKILSRVVPENKKYICSVCGKNFHAFSHRVEHMLIHLGEKPWKCTECKKSFRTKSALKVHRMKHTGERPFVCQLCGKSFVEK